MALPQGSITISIDKGIIGPTGPIGTPGGPTGPVGPTGPTGKGIQLKGSVETLAIFLRLAILRVTRIS